MLAKPGSADDVAGKVLRILGDPQLGAALGRAGRAHVAGRFTIDRLADDPADLYRELLERKGISG